MLCSSVYPGASLRGGTMEDQELKETLSELKEQQKVLLEEVKGRPSPRKDGWDKLACLAPVISGFLIGGCGAFIGYAYNQQQIKLQELQTIERFIPHLAGNEKTKKAAILAMSSLTNAELAAKMASLFASEGTVSALESIAQTGNTKDRTVAKEALAKSFSSMAERSVDENNLKQAEAYLLKAISIKEKLEGPDSVELCISIDRLADLYAASGKLELAEPLLRRSLALKQKSAGTGTDWEDSRHAMRRLAAVLEMRGNSQEASQLRKQAAQSGETALAEEIKPAAGNLVDKAKSELEIEPKPAQDPAIRESEAASPSANLEPVKNSVIVPEETKGETAPR